MMNMFQSDCRCGSLGFPAGADLTLATGRLAKLNSDGHAVLPSSAADITPYVITCGADTGYLCGVAPLTSLSNSRVALKGACQAGQLLVAVGDGRVEAGTAGGAAALVGVAEEVGVEGQLVLLRPVTVGARGQTGAAGAAGAAGATGATGPAGATGPGLAESATDRLAGGSTASVTGDKGTAFGMAAAAAGSGAAFGHTAKTTGAVACAFGVNAHAFGANTSAFGGYSYPQGAESCAFGYAASAGGVRALAFGYNSSAAGNGAVAIGHAAATLAAGRLEIAPGTPLYGYARISGQASGAMQFSVQSSNAAPTDSGSSAFNNADGTLPRGMFTAQLNAAGTSLVFYANVAGTVKSGAVALT